MEISKLKQVVRQDATTIRDSIPFDERKAYALDLANINLDPLNIGSEMVVAGYSFIRSECDCFPLLNKIRNKCHRLALPLVLGDDKALSFKAWDHDAELEKGHFGILTPKSDAVDVVPDILFIPLLAFDCTGVRLGYGKGHYDRTLTDLKQDKQIISVGIAFDQQKFDELPCEPFDQKLDWILTPSGLQKLGD